MLFPLGVAGGAGLPGGSFGPSNLICRMSLFELLRERVRAGVE